MKTTSDFYLKSPYKEANNLNQYKGMWHSHMASSFPNPKEAQYICREGGYSFVGVTEHDNKFIKLPWTEKDWTEGNSDDFVMIRGFEATHPIGHITCLGLLPDQVGVNSVAAHRRRFEKIDIDAGYERFIEKAVSQGAFLCLNHPSKWLNNVDELVSWPGFASIHALEIYNGNRTAKSIEEGYPISILDQCLDRNIKIWAAANPDCHRWDVKLFDGPFNGYSVVFAEELTREAILTGLKEGRFYASTGLEVQEIKVSDDSITVYSSQATTISFIGAGGKIIKQVNGESASYQFTGNEKYIRVQLKSDHVPDLRVPGFPVKAWLQPVWVCTD